MSLYAQTKLEAEGILAEHPNAVIFRLGTLYGLGDRFSRLRVDLVVNTLDRPCQHSADEWGCSVAKPVQTPAARTRCRRGCPFSLWKAVPSAVFNLVENVTIMEIAEAVLEQVPDAHIEVTDMCIPGQPELPGVGS